MSEWDNLPLTDEDVNRKVDALYHEVYVVLDKHSRQKHEHRPEDIVRMKAMKTAVRNLKPPVKDKSYLSQLAVCEETLDSLMMEGG
jgi:hypothetical protein